MCIRDRTEGFLFSVRSHHSILCRCSGNAPDASEEIRNPGSSPGSTGGIFQTVSWCPLSDRCSGRIRDRAGGKHVVDVYKRQEKKAAEILREAGEKADKIRQQREEQSRAKVKSYEERTASAADMKKRTAVLAAKQELIGNVIADACDRVKNLDEEKYFGILKNMAEKYLLPREMCIRDRCRDRPQ